VHSKYIVFRRRYIHKKGVELAVGRKIKKEKRRKRKSVKLKRTGETEAKCQEGREDGGENEDPTVHSAFGKASAVEGKSDSLDLLRYLWIGRQGRVHHRGQSTRVR